jgi:hypothetical protein
MDRLDAGCIPLAAADAHPAGGKRDLVPLGSLIWGILEDHSKMASGIMVASRSRYQLGLRNPVIILKSRRLRGINGLCGTNGGM